LPYFGILVIVHGSANEAANWVDHDELDGAILLQLLADKVDVGKTESRTFSPAVVDPLDQVDTAQIEFRRASNLGTIVSAASSS
jgi:hypothetical protein